MRLELTKYRPYALVCLILVGYACKNDEPEAPSEGTYTKEWVLDINEYLGLDASGGRPYTAAVIDDSRLLVSLNTGITGTLVEINYADGSFIRQKSIDKDSLRLSTLQGTVLLVHEQTDTKTYTLGIYDPKNDGAVDFFSTLQSSAISPVGGELMGLAPDQYDTFYTYGKKLNEDGVPQLWIANWYLEGGNRWIVTNENNLDLSTFAAQLVNDRQFIFTGQNETSSGDKYWSITSVSFRDGYVDLLGPTSTNLPIRHVVENTTSTWMYVFASMGFSSIDHYGDEAFVNPMQEFSTGTLSTRPLVMSADQLFFAVHEGDKITLVSSTVTTTRWTENYWEKTTAPLILLSTAMYDVLVVSPNGFITKYRRHR